MLLLFGTLKVGDKRTTALFEAGQVMVDVLNRAELDTVLQHLTVSPGPSLPQQKLAA